MSDKDTDSVGEDTDRRPSRGTSFGESEKTILEAGNFAMVEGLVPPAVLAHIIRYKLYCT